MTKRGARASSKPAPIAETPRMGRPPVGPAINIRVPAELLEAIDSRAELGGVSRVEWIRRALTAAVADADPGKPRRRS